MERTGSPTYLPWVFLGLAIGGTVVPVVTILPWLRQYGLDVPRFFAELLSSRVATFFAWDVVISAVAVLVAVAFAPGIARANRLLVGAGTLLIGVSCGLPLLLFFWSRTTARR